MLSKIMLVVIFLVIYGCKGNTELTNIGGIQTPSSNTCVEKTIDVGDKGVSATNPRGTFSDIATIPNTNNYVTAYFDQATNTIKISYWNGLVFSHEVVAGDHLTTYLRVVVLSSGVPLIFWTNGSTTVKMASRSAALNASGRWTMGIIDTVAGMASRSINVSVSPADEVGVVYLTNSNLTSAPRFIVCSAACVDSSNYASMSTSTMNIEAATSPTAAIAGQVSIGMSWCQGVAGEYYPAVTYGGATTVSQSRYAVCPQANLSNCLVNTNWNKTTFVSSNNLSSSLYIDPNSINDIPKIVTLGVAPSLVGLQTYQGVSGCAAPGSYSGAGSILAGSATDGSSWLKLLKSKSTPASSANERFHIIANSAAASVKYYNTSNNLFNTFASWNGSGTLHTTSLLAASLTAGSATLLATNNELVSTHYMSVAPQNLVASIVRNVNQSSNSATIDLLYPNSNGNMQLLGANVNSTTAAQNISVSSTEDGRPGVAYIDSSNGTQLTGRLKYAFRDSLQKNSTWQIISVPFTGAGPMYPSLKYDHLNRPWISYYDFNTTAANSRFYLMMNANTDGTGTWKVYQFPHAGTAAAVALPATNQTALGMHYSGGVSYPIMAVIENNTAKVIKTSRFNPNTESWSTAFIVDTLTAAGAANLQMDNDDNGNFALAWVDLTTTAPFAGVEYSASSGGLSWTSPKRVSSDATTIQKIGQGISIKLNPVNGYPAISYYDRAADKVFYSTCSSSPLNCSIDSWTNTLIDSTVGVNGVTTYIGAGPTTTRDQLLSSSLSFNQDGTASVVFSAGNGPTLGALSTGNLRKIDITPANNISTEVFKSGVNASGSINAVNMAVSGHNVASIQTSNSEFVSVFIGAGNELASKSCGLE